MLVLASLVLLVKTCISCFAHCFWQFQCNIRNASIYITLLNALGRRGGGKGYAQIKEDTFVIKMGPNLFRMLLAAITLGLNPVSFFAVLPCMQLYETNRKFCKTNASTSMKFLFLTWKYEKKIQDLASCNTRWGCTLFLQWVKMWGFWLAHGPISVIKPCLLS